ncbi:MAG: class I SAM-dependent methyltransferase, partial [Armatimonadota bacterium]
GVVARDLETLGSVVGVDISQDALTFTRRRGVSNLVCASAESLPFTDAAFDLVTALDVLEHLDSDRLGAFEIRRVMRPGALLIASVPALQALWSGHDVALHHRRRYTAGQFRALLTSCGLRVLKLSYCMTALFPFVLAARLSERALRRNQRPTTTLPEVGRPLNAALVALLKAEAELAVRVNLPVGVSLICVARKEAR